MPPSQIPTRMPQIIDKQLEEKKQAELAPMTNMMKIYSQID
jgi:hypothetical protein